MKLSNAEYMLNAHGERQRYKVNDEGLFELKDGRLIANPNNTENVALNKVSNSQLIEDSDGEFYRNWRPEIQSPNDIWNEIASRPVFHRIVFR